MQRIIREEKQRLRRMQEESSGRVQLDTLNESVQISDGSRITFNEGNEGATTGYSRMQDLAGVNDTEKPKRTVTEDTLEMMDEVREKVNDRSVLEQLAKVIDDDTFRDALREIAEEENIKLY